MRTAQESMEPHPHEDAYARAKYQENKTRVVAAFNNRDSNGNEFYNAVVDFARVKLFHLERQFSKTGSDVEADDFAQEVLIAVWENVDKTFGRDGKGSDGESFYNWLHRICYTRAAKFFHALKHKQDNFTSLTVPSRYEDSDGDEETDNPEIWNSGIEDNGLHLPDDLSYFEHVVTGLMLTEVYDPNRPNYKYGTRGGALDEDRPYGGHRGMNYREIAATLRISKAPEGEDWTGVTENVVKKTVAHIRAREKHKKEKRRA